MSGLNITQSAISDRWTALAVDGEIDMATVDVLNEAIQAVLASDSQNLVVDLTATAFMDSTGLKALVMADRSFEESGRSFALAVKAGPIGRLIELSGVEAKLKIVSALEELEDPSLAG